ncbi:hypothetical protein ACFLYV_02375 [Chloroflexota bacterium]
MIIAEKKCVINGSPELVEQLVMKAIISALRPEKLQASDERHFQAVVRVGLGLIRLSVDMAGEVLSPHNPLKFMIRLKGLAGVIRLELMSTFILKSNDVDTTEVVSQLRAEVMSIVISLFLLWKVKRFAVEILQGFENNLKRAT